MRHVIGYVTVFVSGFAACAALLHYGGIGIGSSHNSTAAPATIQEVLAPRAAAPASAGLPTISDAVARVAPAVVNIDVTRTRQVRGPAAFFRPNLTETVEGNGSGILLSEDGYIVTNNHVIAGDAERTGEIVIRLASGKEYTDVNVVGRDPQTDLAVLKINGAQGLPKAELGDSEHLRVGDWAIAVGNPLGFNSSVTLGIISALNRRNVRNDADALERVIQTDAAINPGNSGGALADTEGRVIGINTSIASSNGGNVGIGFAIPINDAREVIDQLIQQGRVARPYLGIIYQAVSDTDPEMLPEVNLPADGQGVIVVSGMSGDAVRPGSPADRAGLRPFDVIRAIDGIPVDELHSVKSEIQKRRVGDTVLLTIWRDGDTQEIPVTLEEMPENYSRRALRGY
ncbi:MAG: trypsin-like peptidase domain-containing protein [Armatimonadaceae bacterium]